jgi:hypothetical protein
MIISLFGNRDPLGCGCHAGRVEGSDWDFGLYYLDWLDPADIVARGWPGRVFAPGEWGRIVNGGAWLTIDGTKVDLIYRDLNGSCTGSRPPKTGSSRFTARLATWPGSPPTFWLANWLLGGCWPVTCLARGSRRSWTLDDALRPAVAAGVLVASEGGYAFRHELFREAVLWDLLPGERAEAHRAFAEAVQSGPPLSPASPHLPSVPLALHWHGAGEGERALRAAWAAAAEAGAAFAYVERLQMLERAPPGCRRRSSASSYGSWRCGRGSTSRQLPRARADRSRRSG